MHEYFTQPVDQDALRLTRAIALKESGVKGQPNYNAIGDAGTSKGAYQWQPGNFENAAKQYGLDPNDFSPENQDKVAYAQIKSYKDKGYDPGQIASLWNSGSPNNWKDHSGTVTINGQKINYDTPAYVNGVKEYYQQLAQQEGTQPTTDTTQQTSVQPTDTGYITENPLQKDVSMENLVATQTEQPTLGSKLAGRIGDISQAVTDLGQKKQGYLSTGLQAVGGVAGMLGDVTTSALENTPGIGWAMKGIENAIGSGVGKFAQTDTGKQVFSAVQDFAEKHPELSKDIGAGINIVSAIPILKGLGVVKNVALDAASLALKGQAEKSFAQGIANTFTSKTAQKVLANNPQGIASIVEQRAIPEIENGRYVTKDAYSQMSNAIDTLDDQLDNVLAKTPSGSQPLLSVEQMRNNAIKQAKKEIAGQTNEKTILNKINEVFDNALENEKAINVGGEKYLSLQDANVLKRRARKGINWDDEVGNQAGYYVGQSYMKGIEDIAAKEGLGNVHGINQEMAKLIQGQNVLNALNTKKVITGTKTEMLKTGATAGGAWLGTTAGVSPEVSAYLANKLAGGLGKSATELYPEVLRRTGIGATRTTIPQVARGLIGNLTLNPFRSEGLIRGALQQKLANPPKSSNQSPKP